MVSRSVSRNLINAVIRVGLTASLLVSAPVFANDRADDSETQSGRPGRILISVAASWDGSNVDQTAVNSLAAFRSQYGAIPMLHFVSPAYFSRSPKESERSVVLLRSSIRPGDQVGLHVAPWKSIVSRSESMFRSAPTFWGAEVTKRDCVSDCGREVPILVYEPEEIVRIIATSKSLLEEKGRDLPLVPAAHIAGWVASPDVHAALRRTGFTWSFSSVPPDQVAASLGQWPLMYWVRGLWGGLDRLPQPHDVTTPHGMLTEVTTSGALLDHSTIAAARARFVDMAERARANPSQEFVYHIGTEMASAVRQMPRLAMLVETLEVEAARMNVRVAPLRIPQVTRSIPILEQATLQPTDKRPSDDPDRRPTPAH